MASERETRSHTLMSTPYSLISYFPGLPCPVGPLPCIPVPHCRPISPGVRAVCPVTEDWMDEAHSRKGALSLL